MSHKRENLQELQNFLSLSTSMNKNNIIFPSQESNLDNIKYLVSMGADIHTYDDLPIRWASEYGYLEVVKYLVSIGANIHACVDYAITYACENGHLDIVKYLISIGADINKCNNLTRNDIYDLIKIGVKYFGKYKNEYQECMIYHTNLMNELSNNIMNDLVSMILMY